MADNSPQFDREERDARKQNKSAAKKLKRAKQTNKRAKDTGRRLGGQIGSTAGALTTIPGLSTIGRAVGSQTGKAAGNLATRGARNRAKKSLTAARQRSRDIQRSKAEAQAAGFGKEEFDEKARSAILKTAGVFKRIAIETAKISIQILLWLAGPVVLLVILVLFLVLSLVVIFGGVLMRAMQYLPG